MQAQLGLVSVVKSIYKNFHKDHSMKRLALLIAFCFAVGALGVQWATAQAAPLEVSQPMERAKAGQPNPQVLVPAQPPVPAVPPGLVPRAIPATSPTTRPQAGAKTSSGTQRAHPIVPGSNQTAKQPEETKVAQIYRGDGYFDIALAEKLRPVFTKNSSEPASSNKGLAPVDLVRAILGGGDSSQKSANQKTVAETGRP
jgi:hypothetical protein